MAKPKVKVGVVYRVIAKGRRGRGTIIDSPARTVENADMLEWLKSSLLAKNKAIEEIIVSDGKTKWLFVCNYAARDIFGSDKLVYIGESK